MKLAVSNIAWPREQDAAVAELLRDFGVSGIEIAPTKVWPKPLEATGDEIAAYRQWWEARGFRIIAAQSLLFGRPDLVLFGSPAVRTQLLDYLAGIVQVCAQCGAGARVFGSPKNRRIGTMPYDRAWPVAVEFFQKLAEIAHTAGTAIVMEANPPEYGADFVTHAAEAVELVNVVNHPGFRLHLDTGCMTLARDPIAATFDAAFPLLRHFHVSEPNLDPPGASGTVDHPAFAAELKRRGYAHWVSLEMREQAPFTLDALAASVRRFQEWYAA